MHPRLYCAGYSMPDVDVSSPGLFPLESKSHSTRQMDCIRRNGFVLSGGSGVSDRVLRGRDRRSAV